MLLAWNGWRLLGDVSDVPRALLLAPAAVLGYLLADLASGFVHWFGDSCFEPGTPVLGRLLIAPFREHHEDPLAMVRHGFLELHGNSGLVVAPLLLWMTWGRSASPLNGAGFLAQASLLSFGIAALATNQFHRWAHDPTPPRVARWLQRHKLILPPERHARHHRPPHDNGFCVTVGWGNAILDPLLRR